MSVSIWSALYQNANQGTGIREMVKLMLDIPLNSGGGGNFTHSPLKVILLNLQSPRFMSTNSCAERAYILWLF